MLQSHAPDTALLETSLAHIESLVLMLADVIRMQHQHNRLTFVRLERCWACDADREPGDRGDCQRCGAGATRL